MNSVATNKTQQYNTRTKDYIYKWRQKNMDKYRIINRKGQAKYREKHKDKIKMYKKAYYLRKKAMLEIWTYFALCMHNMFFWWFCKKKYTKKLCKKITQKNLTHPDQSKKKHKIEVPFSLFPKCIKKTKRPKKLEICEKIYLLKK